MNLKVPYICFKQQFAEDASQTLDVMKRVFESGNFILGDEVERFEDSFAKLSGVKHAIGVANGTDSLIIALKALKIGAGDEVITVSNSWLSSASSIALAGAKPVFVDVDSDQNMNPELLISCITPKTKAIMPVHLTGQCAKMDEINDIAKQHGLFVIEDAAQSVGALYKNKPAGSLSNVGSFSLHPLKNLNAAGDAGILTTNDDELAKQLRLLRNHGLINRDESVVWGFNSRLDSLQAALLNFRFEKLQTLTEKRRANALAYTSGLSSLKEFIKTPVEAPGNYHVYHTYVVQCRDRDALRAFLLERGIDTKIHYPIPIHLQRAASYLGYRLGDLPETESQSKQILSLPVHQYLSDEQIGWVIESIFDFYKKK